MIKYRACFGKIEKIEVERETGSFVWVDDGYGSSRADKKITSLQSYFDSFDEAKEFLVSKYSRQKESALLSLKRIEKKLLAIKKLSEGE